MQVDLYDARGNGNGKTCPTITGDHNNRVTDYTAICIGNGQLNQISMSERCNALDCMHDKRAIIYSGTPPRKWIARRVTPGECARLQGFPDWWCKDVGISDPTDLDITRAHDIWKTWMIASGKEMKQKTRNQLVKWLKYPNSDSAEYMIWGNGITLQVAYRVINGIVRCYERTA